MGNEEYLAPRARCEEVRRPLTSAPTATCKESTSSVQSTYYNECLESNNDCENLNQDISYGEDGLYSDIPFDDITPHNKANDQQNKDCDYNVIAGSFYENEDSQEIEHIYVSGDP